MCTWSIYYIQMIFVAKKKTQVNSLSASKVISYPRRTVIKTTPSLLLLKAQLLHNVLFERSCDGSAGGDSAMASARSLSSSTTSRLNIVPKPKLVDCFKYFVPQETYELIANTTSRIAVRATGRSLFPKRIEVRSSSA